MKFLKLCVLLFCLCSWSNVYAQLRDYSGIVTEDDGTPLIGVTVLVKNTTNGTVTDVDGKFTIQARPGDYLVFSYVGYETVEIQLTMMKTLQYPWRNNPFTWMKWLLLVTGK